MTVRQATLVSLARLAAQALKASPDRPATTAAPVRRDLRESLARLARKAAQDRQDRPAVTESLDRPALRALVARDRLAARATQGRPDHKD